MQRSARSGRIRTVRLSRRAAAEAERARRWWIANREKAPTAFDSDFEDLLRRLESQAEVVGLPARGEPGVRRVLLERIRYHAYFHVDDARGIVDLLALWHASRGRLPLLRR